MATRTQVAIIGGGPAGLLLSHILHISGIDSIVLERQSRAHVLQRIRAGVLEAGTVDLLRAVGLGERMDREGHPHNGSAIAWERRPRFFIDTKKFTGKSMMAYGQTAITEDLYVARDAAGGEIIDEARNLALHDLTSTRPVCEGGQFERGIGEVRGLGIEASGRATGTQRTFFKTQRILSRPRWMPVWWAKTVASSRQLHWE